MSYARFGPDSDVYVFMSVNGALECCGCDLSDEWTYYSTDAMIAHLREHEAAGHQVPAHTIERLDFERAGIDEFIRTGGA